MFLLLNNITLFMINYNIIYQHCNMLFINKHNMSLFIKKTWYQTEVECNKNPFGESTLPVFRMTFY